VLGGDKCVQNTDCKSCGNAVNCRGETGMRGKTVRSSVNRSAVSKVGYSGSVACPKTCFATNGIKSLCHLKAIQFVILGRHTCGPISAWFAYFFIAAYLSTVFKFRTKHETSLDRNFSHVSRNTPAQSDNAQAQQILAHIQ